MLLTSTIEMAKESLRASDDPIVPFLGQISGFRVSFPDGSDRSAPTEDVAYSLAVTWLANRMSKQDDPNWKPSRDTLHDLGVRITAFLEISY